MRLLFTRMDDFHFRPKWLAKIVNGILVGKIHSEENHPISRPADEDLSPGSRVCS